MADSEPRKEVEDNRRALLSVYQTQTLQYAGFALTFAVAFVGELNAPVSSLIIRVVSLSLILPTVFSGFVVALTSIVYGRMLIAVLATTLPEALPTDSLHELHMYYYGIARGNLNFLETTVAAYFNADRVIVIDTTLFLVILSLLLFVI